MKACFSSAIAFLLACNNINDQPSAKSDTLTARDTVISPDTVFREKQSSKVYSNQRFKDVKVEKVSENKFVIKGKGQIFEAAFGWVVEDGHEELKKGFEMTDAGAPEWGNFEFLVEVAKKRANSSLQIILFETSAKDGSRQHELPILLD